jgi:hypothetical protein
VDLFVARTTRRRAAGSALIVAAIALGAYLRLDQWLSQVLIDDEWHAVHQVLRHNPAGMFLDFGFADYSIPLGILYWYEAAEFGLSELAMRWPMMACGLVTLIVGPMLIVRRVSRAAAFGFALLLATSPLLVIYSRMARPYAITLLLGWLAHFAYRRYARVPHGHTPAGVVYLVSAALATWLHPIVGPFVLAPLVWDAVHALRQRGTERIAALRHWLSVAVPTGLAIAVLIAPPLIANAHSMVAKAGRDLPNVGTFVGVWYAWLGTPSTPVLVLCVVLALFGLPTLLRTFPEARTGVLGLALVAAAVVASRPMFSYNPIATGRYLLPIVPLLLAAIAIGAVQIAGWLTRNVSVAYLAVVVPFAALAAASPLWPMVRQPNTETLHFLYHFDFRPDINPYPPYMAGIPVSGFWTTLQSQPAGTLRIAAAPFYFESYRWDAPRWEAIARQPVIPGFVTALCSDLRPGEVPDDARFRFRNAVHLANAAEVAAKGIDFVVWQKPYPRTEKGETETVGEETAACEAALRARFGTPVFEDAAAVAFRVPRNGR